MCRKLYEDGHFRESSSLQNEFQLSVMQINTLKTAIPQKIKDICKCDIALTDPKFQKYMAADKNVKFVYHEINKDRQDHYIAKNDNKWAQELNGEDILETIEAVRRIKHTTEVVKLRSFQYRIVHHAIVTNRQLWHWKIVDSQKCTLCQQDIEHIKHLFYECPEAQKLWDTAKEVCKQMSDVSTEMDFSYGAIINNALVPDANNVVNTVCLIVKQYIYRQRCKKERVCGAQLRREIWQTKNIEKYNAIKNNKLLQYQKRWERHAGEHERSLALEIDHAFNDFNED